MIEQPTRLSIYRELPGDVALRPREHAPSCRWCRWQLLRYRDAVICLEAHHNPTGAEHKASHYNGHGQCDRYMPSRWTRLLQFLRIRPFVERKRETP